MKALFHSKR